MADTPKFPEGPPTEETVDAAYNQYLRNLHPAQRDPDLPLQVVENPDLLKILQSDAVMNDVLDSFLNLSDAPENLNVKIPPSKERGGLYRRLALDFEPAPTGAELIFDRSWYKEHGLLAPPMTYEEFLKKRYGKDLVDIMVPDEPRPQNITDLSKVREERVLGEAYGDFQQDVAGGAELLAEKSAKHPWKYGIGDRVATEQSLRAGQLPFQITERMVRPEGLLEGSRPREGVFIKGPDVPYYKVVREDATTWIPEWAVKQKLGISGAVPDEPRPPEQSNLPAVIDAASAASQLLGPRDKPRPKGKLQGGIGALRKAPWFALARMAWNELSPDQRQVAEDYAKQAYGSLEAGIDAAQEWTGRQNFPEGFAGGLEWAKDALGFGDQEPSGIETIPQRVPKDLLIMPCGNTKDPTACAMTAAKRYVGPLWQSFNKALGGPEEVPKALREMGVDLHILSAEHGLIPADTLIENYDREMTPERIREMAGDKTLSQTIRDTVGSYDADRVHLATPKKYSQLVADVMGREYPTIYPSGTGQGSQRAVLTDFLKKKMLEAQSAERGVGDIPKGGIMSLPDLQKYRSLFHGGPYQWAPEPGYPEGRARLDKQGTGEGAAAYGWGFYAAEAPKVGKGYQESLTSTIPGAPSGSSKYRVTGVDFPEGRAGHMALDSAQDIESYLSFKMSGQSPDMENYLRGQIDRRMARWRDQIAATEKAGHGTGGIANQDMKALSDYWDIYARPAKSGDISEHSGAFYQLDIPEADTDRLLDYDAPLSEQPKSIQDALAPVIDRIQKRLRNHPEAGFKTVDIPGRGNTALWIPDINKDPTGEDIQSLLNYLASYFPEGRPDTRGLGATAMSLIRSRASGDLGATIKEFGYQQPVEGIDEPGGRMDYNPKRAVSKFLNSLGIPGLKYFDHMSRGGKEGTRNYVVWDQDLLDRLKTVRKEALGGFIDKPLYDQPRMLG